MHRPSHLTVALPFAIPDADQLSGLVSNEEIPSLKKIIQHIDRCESLVETDVFAPEIAYENWLAQCLGLARLPQALLLLASESAIEYELSQSKWAVLQPVHLHAALDHLVLSASENLALTQEESQALFEVAYPILRELSPHILAPTPSRWYIGSEQLNTLPWCSPNKTIGRNIDLWMPHGIQGKQWRRVHNEIQMLWHDHPVNQARLARDALPINALWLFGMSDLPRLPLTFSFDCIFANEPLLLGIGRLAQKSTAPLPDNFHFGHADSLHSKQNFSNQCSLVWLDQLTIPAIQQDWENWVQAYSKIDQNWLKPAYQALCNGHLQQLTFILMSDQGWLTLTPKANDHWKFWRHRDILKLFNSVISAP